MSKRVLTLIERQLITLDNLSHKKGFSKKMLKGILHADKIKEKSRKFPGKF